MPTFTDALGIVLREEGGFVDDARDPGGATNLGVTARTWHAWSGKCPTNDAMRALTPAKVAALYKSWFWDRVAGDKLPTALSLALFDFAINCGPGTAIRTLQAVVGAPKDGVPGPATLAAAQTYTSRIGLAELIVRFNDARRDHYRTLPTFCVFGKGWLARVDRVEQEALTWAG